jgi:hypothetical protein
MRLPLLGLKGRDCLAPKAALHANGQKSRRGRMTHCDTPADRALEVCAERLCAALSLAWHLGGEAEYVPGLGYSGRVILLDGVALEIATVARLTGTLREHDHAAPVADFTVQASGAPA